MNIPSRLPLLRQAQAFSRFSPCVFDIFGDEVISVVMFDQTLSAFQVESLPEYDAVKARFLDSFEPYANALRQSAVEAALLEEFGPRPLCANADFIARIQASLDAASAAPSASA